MFAYQLAGAGLVVCLTAAMSANPASAATVGYWRFEGTNGQAVVTASSEENSTALAAAGKGNAAYSSDVVAPKIYDPVSDNTYANTGSLLSKYGGTGYVQTGSSTLFDGGSFTIEAFVRVTDPNGNGVNVGGYPFFINASGEWQLGLDNSGFFRSKFSTADDQNQTTFMYKTLADGQWHHIALTYDNATKKFTIYLGDTTASKALTGSLSTAGTTLMIGAYNTPTNADNWYFDEVRYSNGVLTKSQFLQAVPEPSSLSLGTMGLVAYGLLRRVRRRMVK